jgi:hypothetical protein
MAARAHPRRHPKRQRASGAGSRVCLQGERQSAQLAPVEHQSITTEVRECPRFSKILSDFHAKVSKTCLNLPVGLTPPCWGAFIFKFLSRPQQHSAKPSITGLRQALNMRSTASVGLRAAMAARGMPNCVTEAISVCPCSCDRVTFTTA